MFQCKVSFFLVFNQKSHITLTQIGKNDEIPSYKSSCKTEALTDISNFFRTATMETEINEYKQVDQNRKKTYITTAKKFVAPHYYYFFKNSFYRYSLCEPQVCRM